MRDGSRLRHVVALPVSIVICLAVGSAAFALTSTFVPRTSQIGGSEHFQRCLGLTMSRDISDGEICYFGAVRKRHIDVLVWGDQLAANLIPA